MKSLLVLDLLILNLILFQGYRRVMNAFIFLSLSSKVNFPCLLAMSVMQLKKFFIANAGLIIVLVITTAEAATMPMMVRDVWIRCLVIESDNITTTLIDGINQFTIYYNNLIVSVWNFSFSYRAERIGQHE